MSGQQQEPVHAGGTRLAAENLSVRFGGVKALDNVSIEIGHQSIVGLIGPNGAGKSTLLSVLSGLRSPNSGRVELAGRDATALSARARAHLGLARTFQHPELIRDLTVIEHLILADRMHFNRSWIWSDFLSARGFRRPDRAESHRLDRLIELFGLRSIADRSVRGLPLGKMRIIELARSLATSPSVLLLDEPSSGLNPVETEQVRAIIRDVVDSQGVSVLLVEHDVDLVLGLSDQVYVLDFGAVISHGRPDKIRSDPKVKAAYLGNETSGESQ